MTIPKMPLVEIILDAANVIAGEHASFAGRHIDPTHSCYCFDQLMRATEFIKMDPAATAVNFDGVRTFLDPYHGQMFIPDTLTLSKQGPNRWSLSLTVTGEKFPRYTRYWIDSTIYVPHERSLNNG